MLRAAPETEASQLSSSTCCDVAVFFCMPSPFRLLLILTGQINGNRNGVSHLFVFFSAPNGTLFSK